MTFRLVHALAVLAGMAGVALSGVGCDRSSTKTSAESAAAKSPDKPAMGKGIIGVSLLTTSNPFFKDMGDAMKREGEKRGYEVRVLSSEMDPARQNDQVKDLLTAKCVAIILTPADSRAVASAIGAANAKGVPVFTADIACLDKSVKVVSHVATDNRAGGVQAGEAVVAAIGGTGKVAILDHPEVESAQLRVAGLESVLSKHAGIQIVARLPANGQRERGFRATQDLLQSHPEITAIFATNDPSALGAVAALEAGGKLASIKVIGFDGQPEAKAAIRDGRIYADAVQYPDRIGQLTIVQVEKYLAGETVEPTLLIPTGLYKKEDAVKELGAAGGGSMTAPAGSKP